MARPCRARARGGPHPPARGGHGGLHGAAQHGGGAACALPAARGGAVPIAARPASAPCLALRLPDLSSARTAGGLRQRRRALRGDVGLPRGAPAEQRQLQRRLARGERRALRGADPRARPAALRPLFILVVAGTSVTREREAGTLALLLSQGTPWGTVLRGKLLGSALVAAVVLVPGGAAALTWGALGAGGPAVDVPNTTMTVRVLLLAGLHLVFWAVCAALGVLVSAHHATSRGALATTLGLWISLWIIVPRLVPAAAAALHPIPARVQFDAQVEARLRELGDSHDPDDPVFARLRDETLTRYGVSRVEDLPFNYAGLVMREGERHTSEAFQQHIGAVQASFDRQARVVEWTGIVSPYLAVRSLSMALAGADLAHVAAFERQAESYRYALIQALNDLHMHEVDASRDRYETVASGAPSRQRIDRAFFERLPTFRFTAPPLDDVLRARLVAVLALVAFVMLALIAFGATIRRGGAHPVR
ncbi:MAG: DUF3526 domain-containing protein [Gemmatimonadetes bacterium]|nr:DUF3526 domain-containing protein [Gemmatimonadota bacterium]